MPDQGTGGFRITAPARLHFGLFSLGEGNADQPAFGGVGAMVDGPNIVVEISPCERLKVDGNLRERALAAVQRWFQWQVGTTGSICSDVDDLPCRIKVVESPELHSGLGVGTQLALSIVHGLSHYFDLEAVDLPTLSLIANRGKRSAVGSWGFANGGLIVDGGKQDERGIGLLEHRLEMPDQWRALVLTVDSDQGASGDFESNMFEMLSQQNNGNRDQLYEVCQTKIIGGLEKSDFALFARGVYELNFRVGQKFSSIQQGPFNGAEVHRCVHALRDMGVTGVGQSSWGPTVFAWLPNEELAARLLSECKENPDIRFRKCWIATPNNCGAGVESVQFQRN